MSHHMEPTRFSPSLSLALAMGVGVFLLGGMVLVGWHAHLPAIIQINPAFAPMQYNTALCLLLSGVGLMSISQNRWRLAFGCGLTVGLMGVLTGAQYMLDIDVGFDQFFMRHYITTGSSHPGRMAPNSALCFSLIGTGLALASRHNGHRRVWETVGLLGALIASLGLVAVIGYSIGLETAYHWFQYKGMAIHTATGVVAVGFGLISLAWYHTASYEEVIPKWVVLVSGFGGMVFTFSLWSANALLDHGRLSFSGPFHAIDFLVLGLGVCMTAAVMAAMRMARTASARKYQSEEHEAHIRAITQSMQDALVVFDSKGDISFFNQVCADMFGWQADALINQSIVTLFDEHWLGPNWPTKWLGDQQTDQSGPEYKFLRGVAKHCDGRKFPVEISTSQWQRREATFWTTIVRDISELKILEKRDLRSYVNRIAISALLEIGIEPLSLHRKLEVALEIILTVPWLAMQYKGSIFLATEDDNLEMVAQKNLHDHLLHACRKIPYGFCLCGKAAQSKQIVFSAALDERHDITYGGIHEHGHYCIPILLQGKLLGVLNLYVDYGHPYDPEEEAFLTTITNTLASVIDRGVADERVQHIASHDILTGLPNRMLFHELLDQEVRRAARYQQILAVGFIDLDHFKEVNDTLGHDAGDLLLQAVSDRTKQQLRDSDTLARLGGDEFTIILPIIGGRGNAVTVCQKIAQALSEPFIIQGQSCQIGASIGLSLFPEHGQSVDTLLHAADHAMYTIKKGGRNGVAVFMEGGG